MQYPIEGLLEVCEDMVEVLLVSGIFVTEGSYVRNLFCGAPSCSESCLFFCCDLLRLRLQSVQYDLQHDYAWVTDEADRSVVLALLQVAFVGNVTTRDWVRRVGHFLVCQILLQIVVGAVIMSSRPS